MCEIVGEDALRVNGTTNPTVIVGIVHFTDGVEILSELCDVTGIEHLLRGPLTTDARRNKLSHIVGPRDIGTTLGLVTSFRGVRRVPLSQ